MNIHSSTRIKLELPSLDTGTSFSFVLWDLLPSIERRKFHPIVIMTRFTELIGREHVLLVR